MKRNGYISIVLVAVVSFCLLISFIFLEFLYYSDDISCACSSLCIVVRVTASSRIAGYVLILLAYISMIGIYFRYIKVSGSLCIPLLAVIVLCVYGNGFMLFDNNFCGHSLNKKVAYLFDKKIGDRAMEDGEDLSLDTLHHHGYKDGLLGYSLRDGHLILYRIGDTPVSVSTHFLFWRLDDAQLRRYLAEMLAAYPVNRDTGGLEIIAGKDMPMDVLKENLSHAGDLGLSAIKDVERIDSADGTTRFRVYFEHYDHR